MSIPEFTEEDITTAIEKAVANAGEEYVYPLPLCSYEEVEDGVVTRCIIGETLHSLLDPNRWGRLVKQHNEESVDHLIGEHISVPPHVAAALRIAQITQDIHETWGKALENYRDVLEGVRSELDLSAEDR